MVGGVNMLVRGAYDSQLDILGDVCVHYLLTSCRDHETVPNTIDIIQT